MSSGPHWLKIHGIAVPWILFCLLAIGCALPSGGQKGNPAADPVAMANQRIEMAMANQPPPTPPTEGSLWVEQGDLSEMFVNPKAKRIGDIVTIRIVENAQASNKAATSTGRSSDLSAGVDSFLGAENSYAAGQTFFNPFSRISGDISSNYKGSGSTQRSGALSAYMTARVVDVLVNGNLVIQGNREVRVNNENQVITLSGIIRPRDISSDNIIQSTYIADAQIAYSGTGIINDRQKPGWFTRIMDKVWPF